MLTLTLSTLGLPMAGVGLLLAIDPIVDMMRTATNVAGQSVCTLLVAAQEGILDRDKYRTADGSKLEAENEPQPALAAA